MKKKKATTPQQRRYAIVGWLAKEAEIILDEKPNSSLGDLKEELKNRAAKKGVPYFDACPGAATPIEQAITIAIARRQTA